jgi:hypothetical protein
MLVKGLAMFVLVAALQQTATPPATTNPSSTATGQNATRPANTPSSVNPAAPRQSPAAAQPSNAGAAGRPAGQSQFPARPPAPRTTPQTSAAQNEPNAEDCGGFPCDAQPQRIVVANPPPVQAPWTLHEKIAWAAYVILACLGYAGIMLALSLLKKIERQTAAAEVAANAAQTSAEAARISAQAALTNAQAMVESERPWLVVTVESAVNVENGFTVTATNRGRSPAQIVGTAEQLRIAADESRLPEKPEYGNREPAPPMVPIILLQGESTSLKSFSRADARELCESDEQFARIENWEEKIFLYGRVIYKDLIATPEKQNHQTDWCAWYIHGRQRSGLVIGGPAVYNLHT